MPISIPGVLADTAIDTSAQLNQGQYVGNDSNNRPSFLRALAPTILVGGAYTASSFLADDPFAKMNAPLMDRLRNAKSRKARGYQARNYYKSGEYEERYGYYASDFQRAEAKAARKAAAAGRTYRAAKPIAAISSEAKFASTAEVAYMRRMAAVSIGRFATAANMAFFLAPALFGATYHGFKGIKKFGYELDTPNMGGHFIINSMQATERQRSIAAMHNSEFNGRSAFGNEAQLYHS